MGECHYKWGYAFPCAVAEAFGAFVAVNNENLPFFHSAMIFHGKFVFFAQVGIVGLAYYCYAYFGHVG